MNEKYEKLISAVLNKIRDELERCYWNLHQTPMISPFENTGSEYSNDTFTVRAYCWDDDNEDANLPNFEYKDFECRWYKHSNRGLTWRYKGGVQVAVPADFLADMLDKCFAAIQKDFSLDNDEI